MTAWIALAALTPVSAWAQSPPAGAPPPSAGNAAPATPEFATVAIGDSNNQAVAVIVNDSLITDYDVDQRTALFLVTAGLAPPGEEALAQIREQVLRSLEDETLQLQEAARLEITIERQDIEDALASVAGENNLSADEVMVTLQRAGVAEETFRKQLAAQIAWSRLVEGRYAGSINISDEQIDAALQRLTEGADRPQFAVSEIFLGVDRPQDDEDIRENAEQIMRQLNLGANFPNVARQFSQAPSAAGGGDIGWVLQGQLPDELDQALIETQPGEIVGPLRSEGGYYLLLVRDRREPAGTAPVEQRAIDPNAPVPMDRFLLPMSPGAPPELQRQAMEFAGSLRAQVRSCEDLPALAQQAQGTVHMKLGEVRLEMLDPTIGAAIRNTPPGEVVPPFLSAAGVEIFVRCDERLRTVVPFVIPAREVLSQQLFIQQLTVLARSYLRDLRRDAVIEIR